MLEKIQGHPLTKAMNDALKPAFFLLSFASVSALLFHYMHVEIMKQVTETVIIVFPAAICLLLTYSLTSLFSDALISVVLYAFHPHYPAAFIIPIFIYLCHCLFDPLMKKHYFKQLPQFVENSVKEVMACGIFLLFILIPLPASFPFAEVFDTMYFFIFVIFLNCLVFYKGYHPALLNALIGPIEIFFLMENIQAFLLNQPLPHLLTHGAMSAMANLSGTGITIGIVLLAAHHFPKGTLLSAFFGVNEQVIFGLPIVMEKEAFVPFVIGGTINGAMPVVLMQFGYLNRPVFDAPYLGIGLEGFLVNFDIRTVLVALLQLGLSVLIWYPYYRKKVSKHAL